MTTFDYIKSALPLATNHQLTSMPWFSSQRSSSRFATLANSEFGIHFDVKEKFGGEEEG